MADANEDHVKDDVFGGDLDAFFSVPRVNGLVLSPDGTRLVAPVQTLSADGTRYVTALWEVDPAGERPARRLTRSAPGESAPAFLPDGTLLFLSTRPDPDPGGQAAEKNGGAGSDEDAALWALPPGGGEAERVASRAGGFRAVLTAAGSERFALAGCTEATAGLLAARRKAEVQAILHERPLVRYWDRDLGPDIPHALTTARRADGTLEEFADCGEIDPTETDWALSPDGSRIAYCVHAGETPDGLRSTVVVADAADGTRIRVIGAPGEDVSLPAFTPDGRGLVFLHEPRPDPERPWHPTLRLIRDLDGDEGGQAAGIDLLPGFPLWPGHPVVSPVTGPEGEWALFFCADEAGHAPVFRVTIRQDGTVEPPVRLTASGAYTQLSVAPDGRALYALRSHIDSPPTPVRLDPAASDQEPAVLPAPGRIGRLPGTLTEVTAAAGDGTPLRSWLVLPEGASATDPAPLLLWVHGGPQSSWNAWTWRWNPWVAAAAGYAVLLPDPALSTGYGPRMHERGWGEWGGNPFTDVMALTDAALEREDLDGDRTGMMGGSFGGYMANWIATQTDRFRAIVSHASLWNLHAFAGTTDFPGFWRREIGDPLLHTERYTANSPHLRAAKIRTPMLVIHGDRDYRVPIGEGLALWADLTRFEVPAKFLYFPDEGHWVLKPNNAKLWYRSWLGFMAHHVRGEEWSRPELV